MSEACPACGAEVERETLETRQDDFASYARESTARLIDEVEADPQNAYFQFAMTFEEANADSIEHGGLDLSGKLTVARRTEGGNP